MEEAGFGAAPSDLVSVGLLTRVFPPALNEVLAAPTSAISRSNQRGRYVAPSYA
jgi:hypothetical protein